MQPHLTFIHISDTHFGPTLDYSYFGYSPVENFRILADLINDFPQPPDFVMHTGDLSHDRSPESYQVATEMIGLLKVPVYFANGNHDDRAHLRRLINGQGSGETVDYTFEVKGERFVVLDGWKPGILEPAGRLSEDQLDWLRAELARDGGPLTVFLHYVPFQMGSPWLDERMILLNGEALHEVLRPARDRLRGVFFGHLHRSCHIIRDGITYTSVPSVLAGFGWRPWEVVPVMDHDFPPAYGVVQYFADRVVVHQYAFPRP